MTSKKALSAFIALALLGFSAALPAAAQPATASGKWTFEIIPYVWFSGLKSAIKTPLQPEQSTEVSFSELSKLVHIGLSGMFEARKDRWGFLMDGMYVDLGKTVAQSGTMPGDVEVALKQSNLSLAALARVVEGKAALDLLAGGRYNYMNAELEVTTGPYAGIQKSTTDNWVDGFVGARLLLSLAKAWTLVGYADIGAGGSELCWQAMAVLDVRLSRTFAAKLGYRYAYFDRPQEGGYMKQTKSGIYAALGINF